MTRKKFLTGMLIIALLILFTAGIKDKDIITAVNGAKIGKSGTLSSLLGEYTVGDTIELTFIRDGKEEKTRVTLEAYPTSNKKA